jgi:hypothetical protein
LIFYKYEQEKIAVGSLPCKADMAVSNGKQCHLYCKMFTIFSVVTPPASTLCTISIPTLVHLFNPSQALNNLKTHWILQQFDRPYVYFNSDYTVPKVPLPKAVKLITHGKLVVSKRTQA